jgi:hypothetical protein
MVQREPTTSPESDTGRLYAYRYVKLEGLREISP